MSKASEHAAAYAAWYAEKEGLDAPYLEWYRHHGRLESDVVGAWRATKGYQANRSDWDAWRSRCPAAPMYWVGDSEDFIGVGDDGGLVFMPVRDSGGQGVDLEDMPRFLAWLHDTFVEP